jgi:hypothetical protein
MMSFMSVAIVATAFARDLEIDLRSVTATEPSELSQFAAWFHQDWKRAFPDFYRAVSAYLAGLSDARLSRLAVELDAFVNAHANLDESALEERWYQLGAQAWQRDLDIRAALTDAAWLARSLRSAPLSISHEP